MLTMFAGTPIIHFINNDHGERKMYQVINYRKGNIVAGTYKTRQAARRAVDRLDNI